MTITVFNDTSNVRRQLQRDGYGPEQADLMARYLTGQTPTLHPAPPPLPVPAVLPATHGEIRAWAQAEGMQVRPKGRVPDHIVAAYAAAHH